jgi:hypothetical protein
MKNCMQKRATANSPGKFQVNGSVAGLMRMQMEQTEQVIGIGVSKTHMKLSDLYQEDVHFTKGGGRMSEK